PLRMTIRPVGACPAMTPDGPPSAGPPPEPAPRVRGWGRWRNEKTGEVGPWVAVHVVGEPANNDPAPTDDPSAAPPRPDAPNACTQPHGKHAVTPDDPQVGGTPLDAKPRNLGWWRGLNSKTGELTPWMPLRITGEPPHNEPFPGEDLGETPPQSAAGNA